MSRLLGENSLRLAALGDHVYGALNIRVGEQCIPERCIWRVRILVRLADGTLSEQPEVCGALKQQDTDLGAVDFDFKREFVVRRRQVTWKRGHMESQALRVWLRAERYGQRLHAVLECDRERRQCATDLARFVQGLQSD